MTWTQILKEARCFLGWSTFLYLSYLGFRDLDLLGVCLSSAVMLTVIYEVVFCNVSLFTGNKKVISLTEFNEKMSELKEKEEALLEVIRKEGTQLFFQEFKKFFALEPKLKVFRFQGYTPYFNDGEQCVYGVNEVRVQWEGVQETEGDYEDGFVDQWFFRKEQNGQWTASPETDFVQSIDRFLQANEQLCLSAFGDHKEITVNADGISVETYDHD